MATEKGLNAASAAYRARSRARRQRLPAFASILAIILWSVLPGAAQETGGAISGTIFDSQKAALPGVTVVLRNQRTNAELTTVTNEQGAFVHPFVPIGRYILTATLQGFATSSGSRSRSESAIGSRSTSRCRSAR